jgi:two-component system sensor histidine kinase YesM
MDQSEGYLSLYLDELESATAASVSNSDALAILRRPAYESVYESLPDQRALAEAVERSLYLRTDITTLNVYATNGLSHVDRVIRFFAIEELEGKRWFETLRDSEDSSIWEYEASTKSLIHARRVTDMESGRLLAYAAARIPTYRIENVLRRSRIGVQEEVALYDTTSSAVVGPYNLSPELGETLRDTPPEEFANERGVGMRFGDEHLILSTAVGSTPLRLVMFVRTEALLQETSALRRYGLIVFVVATILVILVWMQFANRITRPLMALTETMNAFREHETMRRATVETNDEIGDVARSYNAMLDRLNALIREIYEEQLHRKDAEISAMQAYINPHFLNNTLNSIGSLARARGAPEIAQMVTSLAKLFRIVLSRREKRVSLSQELEYVTQYLKIQQIRYGDRLAVSYQIPDEAKQLMVPSFILQPLVENALEHGLEPQEGGGRIALRARIDGESFSLEVEDDGVGMEAGRVEAVLQDEPPKGGRVGLQNVAQRIRALEGPEFGIEIDSDAGRFTTVRLRLPKRFHADSGKTDAGEAAHSEESHEIPRSRG